MNNQTTTSQQQQQQQQQNNNTVIYLPGEFAPNRCNYFNCKNGRFTHKKRLFRFPSDKNPERLEAWIVNSGNEKLRSLTLKSLRRRGLCEDHFAESSFSCPQRVGIKRDAIPLMNYPSPSGNYVPINSHEDNNDLKQEAVREIRLFEDEDLILSDPREEKVEEEKETKLEKNPPNEFPDMEIVDEEIPVAPVNPVNPEPLMVSKSYCDRLEEKMKILKSEMSELRQENRFLRNKVKKQMPIVKCQMSKPRVPTNPKKHHKYLKKQVEDIVDKMDISPVAKTIISLQMHQANAPYTEKQMEISKKLFEQSPAALRELRRSGANFPGINTIRRCLKSSTNVVESEYKILDIPEVPEIAEEIDINNF